MRKGEKQGIVRDYLLAFLELGFSGCIVEGSITYNSETGRRASREYVKGESEKRRSKNVLTPSIKQETMKSKIADIRSLHIEVV